LARNAILVAAFAFTIVWFTYSYPAIGEIDKEDYNYSAVLEWGSGGASDGRFNVPHI
jgi:hypothetical protein